mgnify:CR=1 FL=1
MAKAISKEKILKKIGEENARIIHSPILPEHYVYKELTPREYNLEFSKQKIAELKLKSQEIKILTDSSSTNKQIAEAVKKAWEKIGLNVEIELLSSSELQKAILNKDYSVIILGISLGLNNNPYPYWHSSQIEKGGLNLSKFNNQEVDSLLENFSSSNNQEKSREYLHAFQDIIHEEIPAIFLFQPKSYYLIDKKIKVQKDYFSNKLDRFNKINLWYIKTKRIPK